MFRLHRLGLLLALAASLAWAVDFSALKPQGYVSDFAGVVDARTKAALEQYCQAVEYSTGAQMAFVTLDTLGGEPVEDVANLLFRTWGIGSKENNEGILLLFVIADRRSRIEVGYGLEEYIPDGYAGSLLRRMSPALRAGDFGQAFAVAAQDIGTRVAEAKGVTLRQAPQSRRRQRESPRQGFPLGSIIGGIVLLVWLLGAGGRRGGRGGMGGLLTGMFLGSLLGRGMGGFHGRSGGGFGGFDSGGGFGGFGGGDSGGGGASGGW